MKCTTWILTTATILATLGAMPPASAVACEFSEPTLAYPEATCNWALGGGAGQDVGATGAYAEDESFEVLAHDLVNEGPGTGQCAAIRPQTRLCNYLLGGSFERDTARNAAFASHEGAEAVNFLIATYGDQLP